MQAGFRAKDLVQQILTFSRKEKRELLLCTDVENQGGKADLEPPVRLPGRTGTIMVLDDEPVPVDILSQQLSEMGHRVVPFTHAQKALGSFLETPDEFDLLVTDMAMPEMTGIEVARQMKARRKGFRVVLCTGYRSKIFNSDPREQGGDALLVKPVKRMDLLNTVHSLLATDNDSTN